MPSKEHFRKNAIRRLKKAAKRGYIIDKGIVNALYTELKDAKNIMLYIPLGMEVDIMPY